MSHLQYPGTNDPYRLLPVIDEKLISMQADFRLRRSCTDQTIKPTQHIEDGFEKEMVTGAIFIDLSAAYDTINRRKLPLKLLEITNDSPLTKFTLTMLSNRSSLSFCVVKEVNGETKKLAFPKVVF